MVLAWGDDGKVMTIPWQSGCHGGGGGGIVLVLAWCNCFHSGDVGQESIVKNPRSILIRARILTKKGLKG